MKIIYCASSTNINDLKTLPSNYTSSKINTLFTDTKPYFIKEFMSISNIEYVYIKDYPDFYQIWNDMMNKITFAYNYKYLESKKLYDEYVSFNKRVADEICKISEEKNDLVVINDASLYLLPGLVNCRVAIRNIDFDECFIERVPYYREILRKIMKAEKFFSSEKGLDSFNRYLDSSYEFSTVNRGGCHYMQTHVDKESVLDVLNTCSVYKNTLSSQVFTQHSGVLEHLKTLTIPKNLPVILTNVPLLHLEAYIKDFPRTNIRYIRSSIEIDGKQDRMVQYLKKAYNCVIDVIDKHDYEIIALEMFYCDIFVGSKYSELAKLLRKPFIEDDNDPAYMLYSIKDLIGKMQERACVYEEEQYLKEFMEINGYDILHDVDLTIDDQIDSYILELVGWINGKQMCEDEASRESSVAEGDLALSRGLTESSSSISTNFKDKVEDHLAEMAGERRAPEAEEPLYAKMINGERVLFKKNTNERPKTAVVVQRGAKSGTKSSAQKRPGTKSPAGSKHTPAVPRVKKCCSKNGCSVCSKKYIYGNACPSKTCTCNQAVNLQQKSKPVHWPKIANLETLRAAWETSNRIALLDYDGTLSPIEKLPHLAKPTEELFELLRRFNKKNKCIICTGRSMDVVDEWFPAEFEIYAEHGACHRKDGIWETENKINRIEECIELMEYYTIRTPGSVVEKKSRGCAFHYKNVKEFDVEKLYYLLKRIVGSAVVLGKGVIEVRSSSKYKITARIKPALTAGDDVVDEDMFEACSGTSIRVGEGETKADFYVETVPDFLLLIEQLIE